MEFRQLQYMLKVAEEGSFSKAAQKLYISQPSLSQYIQRIEQQVGLPCLIGHLAHYALPMLAKYLPKMRGAC